MPHEQRFLRRVEDFLGWKLDAEKQDEALRLYAQGRSAELVADRFEKLRVAADSINDPSIRVDHDPPTRPQDDDPAQF